MSFKYCNTILRTVNTGILYINGREIRVFEN
ncbi:hypothetical protein J2Z44_003114 [Clostridium punense]|uniref:Uncharacterized protein n=1 Tax=Clostridium punense TaxID=1054297 RepID=A0ABS4K670_9CLOT|nr:hypothetical protein [Clostridium punense]